MTTLRIFKQNNLFLTQRHVQIFPISLACRPACRLGGPLARGWVRLAPSGMANAAVLMFSLAENIVLFALVVILVGLCIYILAEYSEVETDRINPADAVKGERAARTAGAYNASSAALNRAVLIETLVSILYVLCLVACARWALVAVSLPAPLFQAYRYVSVASAPFRPLFVQVHERNLSV